MVFNYAQLNPVQHLNSRPHPRIRHCPVCGIAMLASKSQEKLADFDTFECLTCRTVITESNSRPPASDKKSR